MESLGQAQQNRKEVAEEISIERARQIIDALGSKPLETLNGYDRALALRAQKVIAAERTIH